MMETKMETKIERRMVSRQVAPVRLKTRADGSKVITGYGLVFYDAADPQTQFWLWDDFVERISPKALDRAISEKHDARGLFNHDPDNLLGRVGNGTMRVSKDAKGGLYEIDFDESDPDHQRVAAKLERGDLSGSSFSFYPVRTTWGQETIDGKTVDVRVIEDIDLVDMGPVTFPAYEATTAGMRSAGGLEDALAERAARRRAREAEAIEIDLRTARAIAEG
ncbi:MAG: HK97 family phage prohead protease [Rhodospirillales bacterium]|jgi:HK97 family phage prohead protease|nr:HK97 family phage prohead protease [Rhodospirillales bacterium]